jgi:cytidylyltransferase family protein
VIAALLIGREGSVGFPGKNTHPVLGRPLMLYPMLAAMHARSIGRCFLSTDSAAYKQFARGYGWQVIDRPPHLASQEALGEDAFRHGYEVIRDDCAARGESLELLALLFCNAPTVTAELIDRGVDILRARPDLDSAVSVSVYNMWSPIRARRETADGTLEPFVPLETLDLADAINCDRDSQGDVCFADMGVSVVRPRCMEDMEHGLLPQKWMGRRIAPIRQWGGLDVDYDWQIPLAELWLRRHGFDETTTPYGAVPLTAGREVP